MKDSRSPGDGRAGFSLVELVVAILLLAVGVLALAGSTAFVIRTVTVSDLGTQRAAALQSTIETLRAQPFTSLAAGSDEIAPFQVSWEINPDGTDGPHARTIQIVTTGPGMQATGGGGMPALTNDAVDTFRYVITRP
jgi:prepilin-type N-terminal cleavage/methylation domain-containing protein